MCVCVCVCLCVCVCGVCVCTGGGGGGGGLHIYFRLADERILARAPALDRAQNWPDTKDSSSVPLLRDYLPCSDVCTTCLPNLGKWAVKALLSFAFFDHQLKPSVSAVYTHIKHRCEKMKEKKRRRKEEKKKEKKRAGWWGRGGGGGDLLPVNF